MAPGVRCILEPLEEVRNKEIRSTFEGPVSVLSINAHPDRTSINQGVVERAIQSNSSVAYLSQLETIPGTGTPFLGQFAWVHLSETQAIPYLLGFRLGGIMCAGWSVLLATADRQNLSKN